MRRQGRALDRHRRLTLTVSVGATSTTVAVGVLSAVTVCKVSSVSEVCTVILWFLVALDQLVGPSRWALLMSTPSRCH